MELLKTKVMRSKHVNKDYVIDAEKIEEIDRYTYLGQMLT